MTFQMDIKDNDAFKREVLEVPGVCQVVELYPEWCGPCKAIQSTFRRIYFDAGDRPLKFFTADADRIAGMEEYRERNQPVFLFYKDGKMIDSVVGVVAPQLERKINQYSQAA